VIPDERHTLPSGWCGIHIRDACQTSSGGTPSRGRPELYGGGIPWIKSGELRELDIVSADETITSQAISQSSAKVIPPGAVLVAMYGATIGRLGLLRVPAATNQAICAIVCPAGVQPRWIFYWLLARRENLIESGKGGAQPNISQEIIRDFPLPLPPSGEQGRIIDDLEALLSDLDAAVRTLEGALEKLKRYRQAVLKAAVEGELSREWREAHVEQIEPATGLLQRILTERRRVWEQVERAKPRANGKGRGDQEWAKKYKEPRGPSAAASPRIPDSWTLASADQISLFITDGEHNTPPRVSEGVKLLSARNVLNGRLDFAKVDFIASETYEILRRRLDVKAGDVLLSCSGSVGRSCVVPDGMRFALVRSVAVIRPVLPFGEFVSMALRSPSLQSQIDELKTQTAQANIFQAQIRRLVVPLPPEPEMDYIRDRILRLSSVADAIEGSLDTNIRRAVRLRQSILEKAFRGELVPQDPADEPASELLERIRTERAAALISKGTRPRKERAQQVPSK
jgi:type I restriction enzyme S subunit